VTVFAVGDLQGCYDKLRRLLDRAAFDPDRHRLWLVGDLINRGPQSLECLRFVRALGPAALSVLGNHDLHLLAIVHGGHRVRRSDTFRKILDAPDAGELIDWLGSLPLLHLDRERRRVLVHAGLPHVWSPEDARARAAEVEAAIRGPDREDYFREMYGNEPARWDDALEGLPRLRCITNYLTRMRFVAPDGTLDFAAKEGLDSAPAGFAPWYARQHPQAADWTLVFGHWAALEGRVDGDHLLALDTGCVWGRCLTGVWLDRDAWHRVDCSDLA
jgi:bis(5'-nucleosyl)-tetraphosphatase (symmetrical)